MKFKESKSIYLQIADRICDEILQILYNIRGIGYFVSTGAIERFITLRKDTFLHEDLPEFFRQLKTLEISMDEIDKMYKKYLEQQ